MRNIVRKHLYNYVRKEAGLKDIVDAARFYTTGVAKDSVPLPGGGGVWVTSGKAGPSLKERGIDLVKKYPKTTAGVVAGTAAAAAAAGMYGIKKHNDRKKDVAPVPMPAPPYPNPTSPKLLDRLKNMATPAQWGGIAGGTAAVGGGVLLAALVVKALKKRKALV